ncbi:MAG: fumarate reductase [Betaproteobacteria bacterium RIFCSPLOWO2_02_FULL_63_19]|nr:MAG: fumarate reductase [Betaproteobacteria bacterium RIFCSPLOWO2_02_FULL_63_19]
MSAQMDKRRPYVRSMNSWWKRDPFFVRYMVMEATSVLVALYAVILLVGLLRLSQGEAAFNGWLGALESGPSILLHVLILVVFLYHLWSWFKVMPKTLPMIFVNGKKLPADTITYTGVLLAVVVNLIVLIILV